MDRWPRRTVWNREGIETTVRGNTSVSDRGRHIVVIGCSAGGLEALDAVLGQLSPDFPATNFAAQHLAENTEVALLKRPAQHKAFDCRFARDGETFRPGKMYLAPADHRLLIKKTAMLVTKGARENRYRPAVDPLFRSAAVSHGSRVVGIVLSGMLDDGTAGLLAIKKCGGVTDRAKEAQIHIERIRAMLVAPGQASDSKKGRLRRTPS